jgi:moderate conductance mechanosensitive channel
MLENWVTENSAPLIGTAVVVGVVYLAYLLLLFLGTRLMRRMFAKEPDAEGRIRTLGKVGKRILQVLLGTLAILIILASVWGVDLGPLVAFGAVFGAALGFGAQDLVKDLIAGFFILAENQFHIGDVVRIADTEGTVEDIQFRVTILRDVEGNKHFVPNGQITVSSNYTAVYARPVLDIDVAYKEDIDRVIAVISDELQKLADDEVWAEVMVEPPEVLGVHRLAESSVVLRTRLTVPANRRWESLREARRRIKNRFDAEGIEIPFPHMTVAQPPDGPL